MTDQVIDAAMVRGLHADACRDHALVAWIVMRDPPEYPDRFIARLATNQPVPYILIADSRGDLVRRVGAPSPCFMHQRLS